MTTHDAAVNGGSLLPTALIEAVTYTGDKDTLSDLVMEWLPRFRYIVHKTVQPIVIVGCMVKEIDPSRHFKTARVWTKRIEIFNDDTHITRELPEDCALLVFMKHVSHARFTPLKNQALRTRKKNGDLRAQTPILFDATIRDLRQLIAFGFLAPEGVIARIRPKYPHSFETLDATRRALLQVQANATVRRIAFFGDAMKPAERFPIESDEAAPMAQPQKGTGSQQRTPRGALKAFMARHPTAAELQSPEWLAAKTDDAKGDFLLAIAHREGIPTTHGSVVNAIRDLRRAAEAAEDAERKRRDDRAAALTTIATAGPHGLPFDPARAVDLAQRTLADATPPAPPPPVRVEGTLDEAPPQTAALTHSALTSAHSAIQQGFEALRLAREHHKAIGEQLDYMEMALNDAQRFAGRDLIVDMQKGMQDALQEAMIAKFGEFLPWRGKP